MAMARDADQPHVLRSDDGGVATLTLNRGERFNPLSLGMIAALQEQLDALARDAAVRVIIIAGAGRGFCAGHDMRELRAHVGDSAWQRDVFDRCSRMMMSIIALPQPVIARVHGVATAAGCQLVSMCDLAVASESAQFALPGVNIGVFCTTPAVGVARNVGRKHVMEMLLTGETIDARTAAARGLVNRAVASEQLDVEIRRYTDIIVARAAAVVAAGKRAFYRQVEMSTADAYALASEAMACNLEMPEAAAGLDAFLEKRPSVWRKA